MKLFIYTLLSAALAGSLSGRPAQAGEKIPKTNSLCPNGSERDSKTHECKEIIRGM